MAEGGVALVTGAGSGIGRESAIALAREGWRLVLAGRRREALEATAAAIREGGGEALVVPTDVADAAQVRALFAAIEARFGRLDFLFNNAGIFTPPAPVDEVPLEDWHRAVAVNLHGMFYCARAAFGLMRRQQPQGGRILNNGSISAHAPRPHAAPYTVTKHALTGLTRQIALDGRPFAIACGQIDIGNAATDMTAAMARGVLQADGSVRPEPRMSVESVARAVVFAASLPLSETILFMTVMATAMPFVGRG